MSETEKCPKCKADFRMLGSSEIQYECGSAMRAVSGEFRESTQCIRNQRDAANAKLAEAEAELKLWKPMTNEEIEAALDAVEAAPLDEETIERIIAQATDPTFRPTEPEHVLMAAKIKQMEAENERLRRGLLNIQKGFGNQLINNGVGTLGQFIDVVLRNQEAAKAEGK